MLNVYLNNGTLFKFKKGKPLFENGKFYIMYQDILYEQELKNVYKVVEVMEDCNSLQRELYRGEILKRGIEVNVVREATINKKGEIKNGFIIKDSYDNICNCRGFSTFCHVGERYFLEERKI